MRTRLEKMQQRLDFYDLIYYLVDWELNEVREEVTKAVAIERERAEVPPLPPDASVLERMRHYFEVFKLYYQDARLYYDAATYPTRAALKQNRLFSLLTWDSYAFAFCIFLTQST